VTDRLRIEPQRIGFVSANCWDAIGAKAFGFITWWINRGGVPVDRHGTAPDFVVGSLQEVAP
jgi:2-haloacid dehalogenase